MQMANGFTVFSLLYGDHLQLHQRHLQSILGVLDPALVKSWRIGLNAVTPDTLRLVLDLSELLPPEVQLLVYESPVNRLKYPMMRKMFYDASHPVLTQYMMWFDDDSCIAPGTTVTWWTTVYNLIQSCNMLGDIWRMPLRGQQAKLVQRQSWYRGLPVGGNYQVKFATGGWWTIKTKIIQQANYPFYDIVHNGGDVMLGEYLRQNKISLTPFKTGVWINADENGNNSKAPRRGESKDPVWYKGTTSNIDHHRFEITATPRVSPRFEDIRRFSSGHVTPLPPSSSRRIIRLPGF